MARRKARTAIVDTPTLELARARFKLGNESNDPQAERERDDTAFENGEQWPTDVLQARMGTPAQPGQPSVPARPVITINKVRRSVQQVLNQERESDIGIEIVPADDFGDLGLTPDDTEITLREGLVRRIQRESQAADARSWAFKRAVIAGRGYYLVMTRYLPGKTWDQEIYVHRIYNQAGVVLDPSHEQPDGSDAEWGFMGTWVPWDRIKAQYPFLADGKNNPLTDYSEQDFIAMTESYPDWYRQSYEQTDTKGNKQTVKQVACRVTDYWYVNRETRELAVLEDGSSVWFEDLPEGVGAVDTRLVVEKKIEKCTIVGGVVIVEQTDWAGPDMPIVKVLGEEILPYDEQRRAEGMVRQARGSQQGLNYMISKQVEMVGLTPIPPLMVDPEAIEGYEAEYALMTTRTFGSLKYRTYNDEGKELRPPMRPPVSDLNMGVSQSIALFDQAVKDTTAVSDPALGQADPSVKSARHARYLIEESRLGNSGFLDNLARSIRYEGQVINNLLYPIYGAKPGRMVRAILGDGEAQTMQIGDPQAQPQKPQMPQQAQQQRAKVAQVAKLTEDAHFNVIVKISKSSTNRRQQFVMQYGDILTADPNQMAVGGDLFYKNMDIPEAKELAERQRVMLAPPVQQFLASKEKGENFDPVAQAKLAELTQRLQHAEAALQQLAGVAEGKQMEAQTKVQIAQMEAELDMRKAQAQAAIDLEKSRLEADRDIRLQEMKDATSLAVARINAETKGVVSAQTAVDESIALQTELTHDAALLGMTQQHEREMAQMGHAHDAALGIGAQEQSAEQAEADRQAAQAEPEGA